MSRFQKFKTHTSLTIYDGNAYAQTNSGFIDNVHRQSHRSNTELPPTYSGQAQRLTLRFEIASQFGYSCIIQTLMNSISMFLYAT